MNKDKIYLFFDLLDAGYKNALVSVVEFSFGENHIEIFLPNVGNLSVIQSFSETDDVQIPVFDVFYTLANIPNTENEIKDDILKRRAVDIAYKCKKYFENHPEHIVDNDQDLLDKIRKNKQNIAKIYQNKIKMRNRWLAPLDKQK